MSTINVHAGDWKTGKYSHFRFGAFHLAKDEMGWTGYKTETILAAKVERVELASEENVKKLGGTIGWGVAGGLLLGPVGLLAGLLAGGRKKEITFIVLFKDGRKLLASTDSKTYTAIQAAVF